MTSTGNVNHYVHELSHTVYISLYSHNILLDSFLVPKICDFGFSVQVPENKCRKTLITAIEGLPGTDGYRPPEYGDRKFSILSDVYSYGVVSVKCAYIILHSIVACM